jgi:hypothetical protein
VRRGRLLVGIDSLWVTGLSQVENGQTLTGNALQQVIEYTEIKMWNVGTNASLTSMRKLECARGLSPG